MKSVSIEKRTSRRMRLLGVLLTLASFGMYSYSGYAAANKVSVCHNGQVIEIDDNALAAHLAHGDAQGACASNNMTNTTGDDPSKWDGNVTSWSGKITGGRTRIGELKQAAKRENDMGRLDCLIKFEGEFEAAVKDFPSKEGEFKRAQGDDRSQPYQMLSVMWNLADTALKEAEQCAGDDAGFVGTTEVKVKQKGDSKNTDDGKDDTGFKGKNKPISRGGLASPFTT